MNIVKAGYQVIPNGDSVTKKIERIARVCYKSEELIGEGTDLKMLNKLVERKHYAMLEHASLAYIVQRETYEYLFCTHDNIMHYRDSHEEAKDIPSILRLRFTCTDLGDEHRYVVSANVRAWLEFFEYCVKFSYYQSCYLKPIVEDVEYRTKGVVNFVDYVKEYPERNHAGMHIHVEFVSEYGILSYAECMVHEDFSVLFTVDRGYYP